MKKIMNENYAVSEIMGTILLIGIAVSTFTVVYAVVLTTPEPYEKPYVNIIGRIDENQVILEHYGGEALSLDLELQIEVGGVKKTYTVNEGLSSTSKSDGKWNFGETAVYTLDDTTNFMVTANLIDRNSNYLIISSLLQDGGNYPTIHINTSVNNIIPFIFQSTPLKTINATGHQSLDTVSLYYRYSPIEYPFEYTTLMYDGFDGGFGNYTDGGDDCWLYNMGEHQGHVNRSINIQDNSGDASSFYLTNGIDIDTLGYSMLMIEFTFQSQNFESNENFYVKYYDGNDWQIIADYIYNVDFVNNIFYHETIIIDEGSYTFPSDMKIKFQCDAGDNSDDIYIDDVYINATDIVTSFGSWTEWNNALNPDNLAPWQWDFTFPSSTGYYEFYSIGEYAGETELPPATADAMCIYIEE